MPLFASNAGEILSNLKAPQLETLKGIFFSGYITLSHTTTLPSVAVRKIEPVREKANVASTATTSLPSGKST